MKNLLIILFSISVFSCAKPVLNSDTALKNLSKLYHVTGPERNGDGTLFYEVLAANVNGKDTTFSDPNIAANKIKGAFDQNLGILPQLVEENKFSKLEQAVFFRYEWETLTEQVRLETYVKRDEKKVNSNNEVPVYIKAKIWIIKK